MTVVYPPRTTPTLRQFRIGAHRLEFVDGRGTDPGVNAGERAYLQGLGFRFEDSAPVAAPAKAPARKAPAKSKPKPRPAEAGPEDEAKPAPVDPAPAVDDTNTESGDA